MKIGSPASPRRKTAKQIKGEETRARLLDAARALFSEYGYDAVSVTEIARDAGVTHGMINVHFGGKPGLLYEIIRENNGPQFDESQRLADAGGKAWDRLSELLLGWLADDTSNPRLLAVMQSYSWLWPDSTEQDNRAVRAVFKDVLQRLVEQGQTNGEFRPGIDPVIAADAIWAIYTWGSRASIFEDASLTQCHQAILKQVAILLTN